MSATLEISSDHRIGFLPNEAYTDPDYLRPISTVARFSPIGIRRSSSTSSG